MEEQIGEKMKNTNFEQFLTAYARGEYAKALTLWDKHHTEFVGNNKVIADTIITLIDPPKPLF